MATETELSTESVLRAQNRVLKELAGGAPAQRVFDLLTRSSEDLHPGVRCSFHVVDHLGRLQPLSAPSMPAAYHRAVADLEVGPDVGSCGAAAFSKRRVVVEDVFRHPNWAAYRDLATAAGFRACWSEPVLSPRGEVLGTFAMYYDVARGPTNIEVDFMGSTAQLAALALERTRSERRLRESEENFRQLAENLRSAVWLTDWTTQTVLYVSPGYETIWGRSCESLYTNARSWSFDIHPDDRERVVAAFARDAETGRYDAEYRIVRADGAVRWIHDRAVPIRDEHGTVYRVAGISADVTGSKELELELRKARDELDARRRDEVRSLTSQLLLAEERERRRIAQDLHDGLNQTLALARMKVARLRRGADDAAVEALREVEALLEASNQAARSLTFQLSPPVLHDLGFEAALQWLAEDVQRTHGLPVVLELESVGALHEQVSVLLFRAARELLINVAKHARAARVVVRVARDGDHLRISVEDDGVAFDTTAVGKRGIGLYGIRERLSHLGGSMRIESRPEAGTKVTLCAPLAADDAPTVPESS